MMGTSCRLLPQGCHPRHTAQEGAKRSAMTVTSAASVYQALYMPHDMQFIHKPQAIPITAHVRLKEGSGVDTEKVQ